MCKLLIVEWYLNRHICRTFRSHFWLQAQNRIHRRNNRINNFITVFAKPRAWDVAEDAKNDDSILSTLHSERIIEKYHSYRVVVHLRTKKLQATKLISYWFYAAKLAGWLSSIVLFWLNFTAATVWAQMQFKLVNEMFPVKIKEKGMWAAILSGEIIKMLVVLKTENIGFHEFKNKCWTSLHQMPELCNVQHCLK